MTWRDAQTYCYDNGGHLAEIHDEIHNLLMTGSIEDVYGGNALIWLGATDVYEVCSVY